MGSKWKLVTFYTEGTPYEKVADPFRNSCVSKGVDPKIYSIPNMGSWVLNTHQKLFVIQRALEEYPDLDIVWTDIDSRVKKYPDIFDDFSDSGKYDACFFYAPQRNRKPTLSNGTMWFANNEVSKRFVEECIQENNNNPNRPDQPNMAVVLQKAISGGWLRDGKINYSDCCIFDRRPSKSASIVHYQASRRFKKLI